MSGLSRSTIIEDAALERFRERDYAAGHGPHLAPGELAAERQSFGDVVQFPGAVLRLYQVLVHRLMGFA